MEVQVIDKDEFDTTLNNLRNSKDNNNWFLMVYENPKSMKLKMAGKGEGGVEEMKGLLSDDMAGYAMVRFIDQIDDSSTIKFVFVNWNGDRVARMQKARMSVQRGKILELFGQFHINYECSNLNELTTENIALKIGDASGSGSRVLDKVQVPYTEASPRPVKSEATDSPKAEGSESQSAETTTEEPATKPSHTPKPIKPVKDTKVVDEKDNLKMNKEEDIKEAIAEVRSDKIDCNWALVGFVNNNTIELKGKGSGGLDEMLPLFTNDNAYYGILRLINVFEENETVKFVLIIWNGENLPRMLRARLGTYSGQLKDLFSPFHVDVKASNMSEISSEIIKDRVEAAAGNKNAVLE